MQIRAAPEADETDADALPSRRGVALPSGEGSGLGTEDAALLVPETRRAAVLERALMRANKAVSPQSRDDAAMRSPGLDDVNMLEATRSPRLDDMLEAMQRQQEREGACGRPPSCVAKIILHRRSRYVQSSCVSRTVGLAMVCVC